MRILQSGQNTIRNKIEFFRCPGTNIGYLKTYKCASTFYNGLLAANGWQRGFITDIDWQKDHVFSFIIDPYVRHIKGMVEDLVSLGLEKFLLNNLGPTFWNSVPWIGFHSMPFSVMLQDYADKIDWIPLDALEFTGEELLTKLLSDFDINIDWNINVFRHESNQYNKQLFNQILDISGNKLNYFKFYCKDFEIYENAFQKRNLTPRKN